MTSNPSVRFFAVERLTVIYIILTSCIILFLKPEPVILSDLLGVRVLVLLGMSGLAFIHSVTKWSIMSLLRVTFAGGLLIYWYPETYEINRMISNYDHIFAVIEQGIFGFQPALEFSLAYPQHWLSEVLNLGYAAYYPLIMGTSLFFYFKDRKFFEYFFFTVLFSFFCYYLIFIIFPVAGPQYYFQAVGMEQVRAGVFTDVGYYFSYNKELLAQSNNSGFFAQLVQGTQQVGERPTAAFPSSHVGVTTLIMLLVYKNRRYYLFAFLMPVYVALCVATVYIQAHYLIDALAGFVTAFAMYFAGIYAYKLFSLRYFGIPDLATIFVRPVKVRN